MEKIREAWRERLLVDARTHNAWLPKAVPEALLRELYELVKLGPTSANCSPLRIVYVTSAHAKERLLAAVSPGNAAKTRAAPVTAVLGYDMEFYERMPTLFPHNPSARAWFAGDERKIFDTAFRNSSLQGGYFILAARGLGLDCGPMSGFDAEKIEAEFFPDRKVRANFLCNLGYGDPSGLFARSPRLSFDEACSFR